MKKKRILTCWLIARNITKNKKVVAIVIGGKQRKPFIDSGDVLHIDNSKHRLGIQSFHEIDFKHLFHRSLRHGQCYKCQIEFEYTNCAPKIPMEMVNWRPIRIL